MKVTGPGKTGKTGKTSKTGTAKKTGDTAFNKLMSDAAGSADTVESLSGISSISQIDALLSVQESGDSLDEKAKQQMLQRADTMLDKLNEIRLGLLSGSISVSDLQDLSRTIQEKKHTVSSSALTSVLNEIEMRAEIELAKHLRY